MTRAETYQGSSHQSPVLVAGHSTWRPFISVMLVTIALIYLGLRLGEMSADDALIFIMPIVAVITAITTLAIWVYYRRRVWLTVHPDGFELSRSANPQQFADAAVTGLSLSVTPSKTWTGASRSVTRFKLWGLDAKSSPLLMSVHTALDDHSHLKAFLERLQYRLQTKAMDRVETGQQIEGEGWQLTSNQLTVHEAGQTRLIPLDKVTDLACDPELIRIWAGISDSPSARLSLDQRDTWLLGRLLADRINLTESRPVAQEEDLGAVLYERKHTRRGFEYLWLTLTLIVLCVVLTILGNLLETTVVSIVIGLFWLFPIYCVIRAIVQFKSSFRLHERGLSIGTNRTRKIIPFANLRRFRISSTMFHSPFRKSRNCYQFLFEGESHRDGIVHIERDEREEAGLALIKEKVSRAIAQRMWDQITQTGQSLWTSRMALTMSGLVWNPKGTGIWHRDAITIPYESILKTTNKDDLFIIHTSVPSAERLRVRKSEDNLHPGSQVFLKLRELTRTLQNDLSRSEAEIQDSLN